TTAHPLGTAWAAATATRHDAPGTPASMLSYLHYSQSVRKAQPTGSPGMKEPPVDTGGVFRWRLGGHGIVSRSPVALRPRLSAGLLLAAYWRGTARLGCGHMSARPQNPFRSNLPPEPVSACIT